MQEEFEDTKGVIRKMNIRDYPTLRLDITAILLMLSISQSQ